MTATLQTRRVYSAEELHRLRNSGSQPKLKEAIEERDGEDAELVKEHVLRGSKSFAARSWKSRASNNSSLRAVSNNTNNKENRSVTAPVPQLQLEPPAAPQAQSLLLPGLGQVPPNHQLFNPYQAVTRRSPTPSLKRQKVESLMKAHGSPTHVRVTAGGRIVPSEQSPLCYPRYGYSAIKVNGGLVKFAPNRPLGKIEWTQATQNGFVAQDMNGRMCQIVDGQILPLNEINGAVQLYMPAPNLSVTRGSSISGLPGFGQAPKHNPAEPSFRAQINALDMEYAKLDHELREIDKTEALHGRDMGQGPKDVLHARRRELVISMDKIRKAIKSLKEQTSQEAQNPQISFASATSDRVSIHTPALGRLPPYLQDRPPNLYPEIPVPPPPTASHFYVPAHQTPMQGHFPYHESNFPGPQWAIPPPFALAPPQGFDGTMAAMPFAPFMGGYVDPIITGMQMPVEQSSTKPPQQAGSTASTSQNGVSPNRSHAVPIKIPDGKAKSTLNPMSPVYKPGGLRDGAKLGQAQRLPGDSEPMHEGNHSSKRGVLLHSSSVSSFETADFFPRNTREYSTRQYTQNQASVKENVGPERSIAAQVGTPEASDALTSSLKNLDVQDGGPRVPVAPPGTPTDNLVPGQDQDATSVPDREAHNMSPKAKRRGWLFIQEDPSQDPSPSSPDPEKLAHSCGGEFCVDGKCIHNECIGYDWLDYSDKSRSWIEGFQAGINGRPIPATCYGQFLDGYCSGLLKAKPADANDSTGSPLRPVSRRPSPAPVMSRSSVNASDRQAAEPPGLVFMETTSSSVDTLKQAIIAPHNEDTVLTPAADGPHVNETPFYLGAWTKQRERETVTGRQASLRSEPAAHETTSNIPVDAHGQASPSSNSDTNYRVSSMTSIDASLHRQLPGYRMAGPHLEYKSASSIAHQSGLASASFANAQFDGTGHHRAAGQTNAMTVMQQHRRFKEGSFDDAISPLTSSPPMSPRTTPKTSPSKYAKGQGPSPARNKFEHLVEKVGIKSGKDGSEPVSPPNKRRWRDVWRGSRKEGMDGDAV